MSWENDMRNARNEQEKKDWEDVKDQIRRERPDNVVVDRVDLAELVEAAVDVICSLDSGERTTAHHALAKALKPFGQIVVTHKGNFKWTKTVQEAMQRVLDEVLGQAPQDDREAGKSPLQASWSCGPEGEGWDG